MASTGVMKRATSAEHMVSQPTMIALMWAGVVISVAFVTLRTFIQWNKTRKLFVNDHFIFIAVFLQIATSIIYQYAIPPMYRFLDGLPALQAGQIMTPKFAADASYFLKLQFAVLYTMWSTLWAVKFSLLFFFWRLFDSVTSPMRIMWWVMTFVTASTLFIAFVLQFLSCKPLSNFFVLGGCSSPRDVFYSNLVFRFVVGTDIAGDILIMIIPFPLLWKLRVNTRQKNILIGVFLLPILPMIFAILRLAKANATDGPVDMIAFQVYSMLEITTAVITSCLPSLRLFVSKQPQSQNQSYPRYGNTLSSTSAHNPFWRGKRGSIPLDTFVETQNGDVVESGAGIHVKQDFHVESNHIR